jgi:hypothetical protein
MKNYSKVSLPIAEANTGGLDPHQEGGSSTTTPPPPPIEIEVHPSEGGMMGSYLIILIVLFMVCRWIMKKAWGSEIKVLDEAPKKTPKVKKTKTPKVKKTPVSFVDSPEVKAALEELYKTHPNACRNCHASCQEPEFIITGEGEEECHACYARGRDPYDTTKKMKKDGEYLISTIYGIDPLYRGSVLPGQKILAMREEEDDQWEA